MLETIILDNFSFYLVIILIGFVLGLMILALVEHMIKERGLRDLYKIIKKETGLLKGDALIIALAYDRLGMKTVLKILNGVYEE